MIRRTIILAAALAALLGAPLAQAQSVTEVAGVKYESAVQIGNGKLLLNGAGIRYKAIFKVYAAGLYLGTHATTPETVYAAAGPKRIRIVMYREIDANELGKLFTQGMEKNVSTAEFTRAINGTIRLGELFAKRKKLVPGTTLMSTGCRAPAPPCWSTARPRSSPSRSPSSSTRC